MGGNVELACETTDTTRKQWKRFARSGYHRVAKYMQRMKASSEAQPALLTVESLILKQEHISRFGRLSTLKY